MSTKSILLPEQPQEGGEGLLINIFVARPSVYIVQVTLNVNFFNNKLCEILNSSSGRVAD
jgi:hypothetical protein